MEKSNSYDKTAVFEKQVKPLLDQLERICRDRCIPFYATFAIANDKDGTVYENISNGALPMGIELKDDRLVEHLKIAAGWQAMAGTIPEIEL